MSASNTPSSAEILTCNERFYYSAIGARAYYDLTVNEMHLGNLSLEYSYQAKTVKIHGVNIIKEKRGQGYGKAIFKKIPSLRLPDDPQFEDSNFRFVSGTLSPGLTRVWESLVREGLATQKGERSYEMIN